ncbi:MAG: hypothetical protein CM15mP32_4860 [Flavobacteriaceae bacterium]|nr:MAG: hypothetical protein CM15mP32_4860 [Flavobacteriaceae bacterium]
MWSIGNEVPDLDTEVGKKNAKMLSDICREMDPTRPVNAGYICQLFLIKS